MKYLKEVFSKIDKATTTERGVVQYLQAVGSNPLRFGLMIQRLGVTAVQDVSKGNHCKDTQDNDDTHDFFYGS